MPAIPPPITNALLTTGLSPGVNGALRRTFACQLLEDGVDIKMVAELLGHKNIEVTHKYYAQYNAKARKELMLSQTPIPEDIYDEKKGNV